MAGDAADHDVLAHGKTLERFGGLEGPCQPLRHDAVRRIAGDVAAVEADGSGLRRDLAGEHVEQGGLAGAVGPDQRDEFSGLDVEADVRERPERAESHRGRLDPEQSFGHERRSAVEVRMARPASEAMPRSRPSGQ